MTRAELLTLHTALSLEARNLMELKNKDYGGGTADPFFNFKRAEMMGICSAQAGMLTRICDKVARLVSFTKNGSLEVASEGVRDTCIDLINYAVLFAGMCGTEAKK